MITQTQLNKINELRAKGWKAVKKIPTESGRTQILLSKGSYTMVVNSQGQVPVAR